MQDGTAERLTLLLVLHNHQPVGNLAEVFRQTYDLAYLPFVQLLERHPTVRAALHYTGPLLEWLQREEPAFLGRLMSLQSSGRVELLGGALYEPILAVIPDEDKLGQLRALSDRIEALFGRRPRGAWLAERVWEPHLPRYFARAGLGYTFLDQEHFEKAGLPPAEVDGAWVTEDVGEMVTLLAGSTDLRYLIPWRSVEEAMAFLWDGRQEGRDLLVFADDGEKLGAWPGTYRLCYEEGWLERFFSEIERASAWLTTATPSDYLARRPARSRIYIPSASYPEMEDWSLRPDTQRAVRATREGAGLAGLQPRFVRLGHWRGFLSRYAESNLMLQRGAEVSQRVHAIPVGPRKDEALDHLWRGQCNCPYWHGVFGGIYLYHIRHATFGHLVAADSIASMMEPTASRVEFADFDADGTEECRLSTPEQSLFLHPLGGRLFEWDLPEVPLNLLNTLAPYHEAYADPIGGPVEPPARHAFMDHILDRVPTVEDVVHDRWPEAGALSSRTYHLEASDSGAQAGLVATYPIPDGSEPSTAGWRLSKNYLVRGGETCLTVSYSLAPTEAQSPGRWLAVELNLALPPGAHTLGRLRHGADGWSLAEAIGLADVRELELQAPGLVLTLAMDRAAQVVQHPLWSAHRSELGEEKVYQGTRVVLVWPLSAQAMEDWKAEVQLRWSTSGAI